MYTTSLRAPIVDRKTGKLISRPSADPKPALKYFVLDPVHGDIIVFPKKEEYLESQVKSAMFIKMKQIVCAWGPSGRSDMARHGIENSIELNFLNESIMLLGAYDKAQMNEWLVNLQKAKKFADWYFSIKVMIKEQDKGQIDPSKELQEAIIFKLREIIEFCENYSNVEEKEIEHFSKKDAAIRKKQ